MRRHDPESPEWLELVREKVQTLRFGVVQIYEALGPLTMRTSVISWRPLLTKRRAANTKL